MTADFRKMFWVLDNLSHGFNI